MNQGEVIRLELKRDAGGIKIDRSLDGLLRVRAKEIDDICWTQFYMTEKDLMEFYDELKEYLEL